ncbi:hypothetical protein NQD34_015182 [Periophthalmus magnuspinnatus]|nr:hypothetical protein NQD34_015182 [Periophthalmus magnuspinnatus]
MPRFLYLLLLLCQGSDFAYYLLLCLLVELLVKFIIFTRFTPGLFFNSALCIGTIGFLWSLFTWVLYCLYSLVYLLVQIAIVAAVIAVIAIAYIKPEETRREVSLFVSQIYLKLQLCASNQVVTALQFGQKAIQPVLVMLRHLQQQIMDLLLTLSTPTTEEQRPVTLFLTRLD